MVLRLRISIESWTKPTISNTMTRARLLVALLYQLCRLRSNCSLVPNRALSVAFPCLRAFAVKFIFPQQYLL